MSRRTSVSFATLSENYPDPGGHIGGGCEQYSNQCAIRMSRALSLSGLPLAQYGDPICQADNVSHARGAESLANYLRTRLGPPRVLGGAARSAVQGRKGIIFFKDIIGFRGGRGDHIDLWDGAATRGYDGFGHCAQVWFWELD
jgi:hypothetical protein